MQHSARPRLRRASTFLLLAASASLLAACATPEPKAMVAKKPRSKEYFAESVYGVKASPYVGNVKLVGRDQTGKPYQVRGKWYYPKEVKNYTKVGAASWYGEAFHGRMTANGEVYNIADITAAHPTMPLPSYAKVTNLENGSSIIVRVNDRGPFHEDRVIDLSKRAAEMLGYARVGTTKVKVDYVGRAPLDVHDQPYLMASYKQGKNGPDPSVGLPTGVMIAMNGKAPSTPVGAKAAPFPGTLANTGTSQPRPAEAAPVQPAMVAEMQPLAPAQPAASAATLVTVVLPEFGPIVPSRPDIGDVPANIPFAMASLSYADQRVAGASAFDSLDKGAMSSDQVVAAWKRANGTTVDASPAYVAAGTFGGESQAHTVARALAPYGNVRVEKTSHDGHAWYSVDLFATGSGNLDDMLQAAWTHGAPDAFVVRD